jgi:hypothetical protein
LLNLILKGRVVFEQVAYHLQKLRVGRSKVHEINIPLRSAQSVKGDQLAELASELILEGNNKAKMLNEIERFLQVDSLDLVVLKLVFGGLVVRVILLSVRRLLPYSWLLTRLPRCPLNNTCSHVFVHRQRLSGPSSDWRVVSLDYTK